MVVQIVLAFVLFAALLVVADRFASAWTIDDPVSRAEHRDRQRRARQERRSRRRLRLVRRRPVEEQLAPTCRPIQVVAADLRRISRQLALVPAGSPLVRWKALWAAYDGVLVEAADMLEVPHDLSGQPSAGVSRDIERVRVLAALEAAGLVVRG